MSTQGNMGHGDQNFLCPPCLDKVKEPSTVDQHGLVVQRLSHGATGTVETGKAAAGPDEVSLGAVVIEGLEEKE